MIYEDCDMELKEYQKTVMDIFKNWFYELNEYKKQLSEIPDGLPEESYQLLRNYPKFTWDKINNNSIEHIERKSSAGYYLPHVCLNIPTGGGKTLLGVHAIKNLGMTNGFVLWIVPTTAIFDQTMKAFKDKNHEYRHIFDTISGGNTLIFNSKSRFRKEDYLNNLCVMIMTLSTANRMRNPDYLIMNRFGSGDMSFFPEYDDTDLSKLPSNIILDKTHKFAIHSLQNVFKIIRPVIILDESHKAYSDTQDNNVKKFLHAIQELNPRLMIELSATPSLRHSNLLVNVSGNELHDEEMIKMPIKLHAYQNSTWQRTLNHAVDCLDDLQHNANQLSGRYIRPICVIRVEITDPKKDQQNRINVEKVKKYLLHRNINPDCIKIKTTYNDELKKEFDLMSQKSQVRYIITKDALKEGWDCSFAYVLVLLDNTKTIRSITQMLGRVMRQPDARKTNVDMLDSCHVFCFNQKIEHAVQAVKTSLENDGMKDLKQNLIINDGEQTENILKYCDKTPRKRKSDIFLPTVFHKNNNKIEYLDYERDIQFQIPQKSLHANADIVFDDVKSYDYITDITLDDNMDEYRQEQIPSENHLVDPMFFVYGISDLITNPWQAYRIVSEVFVKLRKKYNEDIIATNKNYIKNYISETIQNKLNKKAEKLFKDKLDDGIIEFKIEMNSRKINLKNPIVLQLENCDKLSNERGKSLQKNLYDEVYRHEFDSSLERDFAIYLDGRNFIKWWHRIAVGQLDSDYKITGWLKDAIHPDFLAYRDKELFIIETKGEHLKGNVDTEYKRKLMTILENAYKNSKLAGELQSEKCKFMMLYDNTWKRQFDEQTIT